MGTFEYDRAHSVQVEDRTLAHLGIVIMNKLRRSEPFMLELSMSDGSGHRSYWIHPGVPLQFRFYTTPSAPINRAWIEQLMASASGPNGLTLTPEPELEPCSAPPSRIESS